LELALFTNALRQRPLTEALDLATSLGLGAVEVAVGGAATFPHLDAPDLLRKPAARRVLEAELKSRGLRICALNCSGFPMHPEYGEAHTQAVEDALRLAHFLEVDTVVAMSGCPGDSPNSRTLNWIVCPWPTELAAVLGDQWERAIEVWAELADLAKKLGTRRIALELHPMQLAYNVPTLLRLRNAIGPIIGANVDPSHLFWQQMDPVLVVRALGDLVCHVHLKDLEIRQAACAIAGVLDTTSFSLPDERSWNFRTVGRGHGAEFWQNFLSELRDVGYRGSLSVENEDPFQTAEEGCCEAVLFMRDVLGTLGVGDTSYSE